MTIQINNYTELLEFIKRKEITAEQATEIVCKALNLVCIFEKSKDEVIKDTEYHIKNFCQNGSVCHPIILGQTNIDFDIKEIYKS